MKSMRTIAPILLLAMLSTACSGGGNEETVKPLQESAQREPTELVFASELGKTPEDFEKEIAEPLRKKFPWLTLKYIERGKGNDIADLVTAGTTPDIYWYVYNRFPNKIQSLGLEYDMSDLIKKYNFDMKRLDQASLQSLDQYTGGKGVYGFPFVASTSVMYYNKDIFDKFGVSYPTNGMTWDEVYNLARQLTRSADGVNYRGLATFHGYLLRENPYGLKPIDPSKEKASVNTEEWKKLFQNLVRIYQIPGNNRDTKTRATNIELQAFAKDQNIAMAVMNNDLNHVKLIPEGMNWDVVSMPTFADKPKIADQPSPWMYSIMSTSKHKDAAFEVLSYLVSDEFFMMESKRGVRTPTTNEQIKKAFGSDSPLLKGKNVGAYYYYPSAPPPALSGNAKISSLIGDGDTVVNNKFLDIVIDGKDINTALREADEEINKRIEESKKN